jgi:hypothetical protein
MKNVVLWVVGPYVSKEHIASIFRVEKSARGEAAWAGARRHSSQLNLLVKKFPAFYRKVQQNSATGSWPEIDDSRPHYTVTTTIEPFLPQWKRKQLLRNGLQTTMTRCFLCGQSRFIRVPCLGYITTPDSQWQPGIASELTVTAKRPWVAVEIRQFC